MLPFIKQRKSYSSHIWPGVRVDFHDDHLLIKSDVSLALYSNAVVGEVGCSDHIVNWRVGKDFDSMDPAAAMREKLEEWSYPRENTTGLMTAAYLHQASLCEEAASGYRIVCCTTAGTGNAARAGMPRPVFEDYHAGTINIVILIDAKLTVGAMMNTIMTATEAKAAALQDAGIRDHLFPEAAATGTTSDAIVIAANMQSVRPFIHRYAGTVTPIGNAVGRLVYQSVREAVEAQF